MIKTSSRLVNLECLQRAVLPRSFLRINLFSARECSSKANLNNVNRDNEVGKDPTSFQLPVVSIIESVQQFGFEEHEMKMLLNSQPELIKKPCNSWRNVIEPLLQADFDKSDIFTILEKKPSILSLKNSDLNKKLLAWNGLGFGSGLVCNLLTTHPHLLDVECAFLTKRIKQYQKLFESKRRVGKLLLLAPNTLEESWEMVCEKLNYLNELCTDNSEIVASGVLAHSLLHIKVRHEFLIRAGVFKRPGKDFIKKLSKNPKLVNIVNTTDDEFVSKVAGLSLFEYSVFLEMFEEELVDSLNEGEIDSDDETVINKLSYTKNMRNK